MKILNSSKLGNNYVIGIEVDSNEWKKTQEATFKNIANTLSVPGFRPGKAPLNIVNSKVSKEEILERSANTQIRKSLRELQDTPEFTKISDEIISWENPSADVNKITESEFVFTLAYDANPEVTLPDLKKLKLDLPSIEVSDKEVNSELNRLLKHDIMLESDENGIINDGSSVVIDFKGFKDGVAFAGGEAKDYELIVGSQQFIPGFEEQMVGMKTGETKTIEVTFPQDYHSNDLAGQPVKFDVTVKAVNIVRKPTIDKTYLEKFKIEGVDDEVKFRAYLKQQLFDWKNQQYKEEARKQIIQFLSAHAQISYIPDIILQQEMNRIDQEVDKEVNAKGGNKLAVIKHLGYNEKTWKNYLNDAATKSLIAAFAIDELIEKLNITPTQEDVNDYLSKAAKLYNKSLEEITELFADRLDSVKVFLSQNKLFEQITNDYKK